MSGIIFSFQTFLKFKRLFIKNTFMVISIFDKKQRNTKFGKVLTSTFFSLMCFSLFACNTKKNVILEDKKTANTVIMGDSIKEATFGAGCFWCVEACFQDLKGVISVQSGYSGGQKENPTYEAVCSGLTGHAEVARIVYDEAVISFEELLEAFWFVHDPTQLNRQGNDIGTQYRSAIFYHDENQKALSEKYKAKLDGEKVWEKPIVTEISPLVNFYPAEKYHDDYFARNPENSYCQAVVRPKVDKFRKVFGSKLK